MIIGAINCAHAVRTQIAFVYSKTFSFYSRRRILDTINATNSNYTHKKKEKKNKIIAQHGLSTNRAKIKQKSSTISTRSTTQNVSFFRSQSKRCQWLRVSHQSHAIQLNFSTTTNAYRTWDSAIEMFFKQIDWLMVYGNRVTKATSEFFLCPIRSQFCRAIVVHFERSV